MYKIFFACLLVLSFAQVHGQHRRPKTIERDIASYESKIQDTERILTRNRSQGITAGNQALENQISTYESQITTLLEELELSKRTDRTETAFVDLQGEVDELRRDQEALLEENAALRARIKELEQERKRFTQGPPNPFIKIGKSIMDTRDSEYYGTIRIGTQVWMRENMRYNIPGSQVNPNNPSPQYGRLYNWKQANEVCPNGWHLPTDEDWKLLERNLGMSKQEANLKGSRGEISPSLRSISGWTDGEQGTDASYFNALPSGYYDTKFSDLGLSALFWTGSKKDKETAWIRDIDCYDKLIQRAEWFKDEYISCRCIKN